MWDRPRVSRSTMQSAHQAVARAFRCGDLDRGPCIVCGATEDVEAHHEDYSKPLAVVWYCITHHRQRHAQMGDALVDTAMQPEEVARKVARRLAQVEVTTTFSDSKLVPFDDL